MNEILSKKNMEFEKSFLEPSSKDTEFVTYEQLGIILNRIIQNKSYIDVLPNSRETHIPDYTIVLDGSTYRALDKKGKIASSNTSFHTLFNAVADDNKHIHINCDFTVTDTCKIYDDFIVTMSKNCKGTLGANSNTGNENEYTPMFQNEDQTNGNNRFILDGLILDGNASNNYDETDTHIYQRSHVLYFRKCNKAIIRNCYIEHGIASGIYWYDGVKNKILENHIEECGVAREGDAYNDHRLCGMYLEEWDQGVVAFNDVEDCFACGIVLETHTGGTEAEWSRGFSVIGNHCSECVVGIYIEQAKSGSVVGNICFENNKTEAYETAGISSGIRIDHSTKYISIESNICISNGDASTPEGCNFYGSGDYNSWSDNFSVTSKYNGYVIFCDRASLHDNWSISDGNDGFYIYAQDPDVIHNHIISPGDDGIYLSDGTKTSTTNVNISLNEIYNAGGYGIRNLLYHANINDNTINTVSTYGIRMEGCDNCRCNNNYIETGGNDGIIFDGDNNILIGNRVTGFSGKGIYESGSADYSIVIANNCLGNTGTNIDVDATNSKKEHNQE